MTLNPTQKVEILRACCCVAGADGKSNEQERRVLQRLADEVGVGKASLEAMIERAETDTEFYKEQFRMLECDPPHTMAVLLQAALADGALIDSEIQMLRALGDKLSVPDAVFSQLMEQAKSLTK